MAPACLLVGSVGSCGWRGESWDLRVEAELVPQRWPLKRHLKSAQCRWQKTIMPAGLGGFLGRCLK